MFPSNLPTGAQWTPMDPNPLQYQDANENEPLYRAAMLSGLVVGVIILLVVGINFVVRHAKAPESPSVRRDAGTSPDDSVNGMKQAMSEETGSGPASGGLGSGYSGPSANFSGSMSGLPGPAANRSRLPTVVLSGQAVGAQDRNHSSDPPTVSRKHAAAMKDWTAINPEDFDDPTPGR